MEIHTGEVYGKQTSNKFIMYNVVKVHKANITLQNIDNPQRLFEITTQKLSSGGYIRISQTPYIELSKTKAKSKRSKTAAKMTRCPYTMDFLESRADSERPAPISPDLFD